MKRSARRAVLAAVALAAAAAGLLVGDRLLPPDLGKLAATSVVVADKDNEILRAFTTPDGKWRLSTRADDVDPLYLRMLIAYEDKRFEEHVGVDPLAALRATGQLAASGRVVSGASTISMQAARLMHGHDRSLAGKLGQAARAVQIERRLGKDGVLAAYLTLAPFGGNLEGVRAASLSYFGKEPRRLTVGEAALLVALPQSPERLRPDLHPESASAGRQKVLRRLVAAGVLTPQTLAEAEAEPLPKARRPLPFNAPHLAARLARGAEGPVRASLDGRLQRALETLARNEARWSSDGGDFAIVAVENRGRRVRAWVGSSDFGSAAGQVDLARARRSPGSTLKPFVYAMAFDDGIAHPASLVDDAPHRFGDWAPRNFDRLHQGAVTLREALQQSLNIPAVMLLDRVGPVRFVSRLRESGARLAMPRLAPVATLPIALGGVGVSLADLVMLYAALADGGRVQPLALLADEGPAAPRKIVGEAAAEAVADMLAGSPMPEGWSRQVARRISFKTGTSYGFRDAWAVGFSREWTVGIWSGRADGTPRPGHFGRNTAAPVLLKVFDLLPPEETPPLAAAAPEPPPRALRRLDREAQPVWRDAAPLRILFPPDGATIEWQQGSMPLRAEGGTGALAWIVDGVPVTGSRFAAETEWRPEGEGFVRIAVVDARGRSTAVRVRLCTACR